VKTIDLGSDETTRNEIFQLAEEQNLLVRTAAGRLFVVAEVGHASAEDFADEVVRTRSHPELHQLLAERSQEPGVLDLNQVRDELGLN
jgi:hypothetical protein